MAPISVLWVLVRFLEELLSLVFMLFCLQKLCTLYCSTHQRSDSTSFYCNPMSIRLLSAFLGFWEGFQEYFNCLVLAQFWLEKLCRLCFSTYQRCEDTSVFIEILLLFLQIIVLWLLKKKIFLLSSSISVCTSCAEFVSEIFVHLIWFCAVQSSVLNCFF